MFAKLLLTWEALSRAIGVGAQGRVNRAVAHNVVACFAAGFLREVSNTPLPVSGRRVPTYIG